MGKGHRPNTMRQHMKRVYRSSTIELGPNATVQDAAEAILAECREQGHAPKPDTVRVHEVYPSVTDTVVRYHPRKGPSRIVDVAPENVVGLAMRWRHSVHPHTIVATRWTGYVEVLGTDEFGVQPQDRARVHLADAALGDADQLADLA